jgi:hypothetical protein
MDFDNLDPIQLRSIIPLRRPKRELKREPSYNAEEITGLSKDTLERRFPHLIRDLSYRRRGMQLGDALSIAAGK